MTLYAITLGFDEKLPLRFLLRHGLSRNDSVLILVPTGFREEEKSKRAFSSLTSIIKTWLSEERIRTEELNLKEPIEEVVKLEKLFVKDYPGEEKIVAGLSGGMRALSMLAVLSLARISMKGKREVQVEVDFENLEGYFSFPLKPLFIPPNPRFLKILRVIMEEKKPSTRKVAEKAGLSHTTIHRELSVMRELGLVDEKYRITDSGRLYLNLSSEM